MGNSKILIRLNSVFLILSLLFSSMISQGLVVFESQDSSFRFCQKRMALVIKSDRETTPLQENSSQSESLPSDAALQTCIDLLYTSEEEQALITSIPPTKKVEHYHAPISSGVIPGILRPPQV